MKTERLVLKDSDILVVKIPSIHFDRRNVQALMRNLRKKLYPRKNPIIILPDDMKLEVIAKEELKEVISYSDEWELWDGEDDV